MVTDMRLCLVLAMVVALAAALSACSPRPEPVGLLEATDANCRLEFLRKLPQEQREGLAGKCFRRGTLTPSEPRNW